MNYHEKIRARMEDRGIRIADLLRGFEGEGGRTSFTTLKRWIEGETVPHYTDMVRIARALGLSMNYLADDAATEIGSVAGELTAEEARVLEMARQFGVANAAKVLGYALDMGMPLAKARLLDMPLDEEPTGGAESPGNPGHKPSNPGHRPHGKDGVPRSKVHPDPAGHRGIFLN